MIVSRVGFEPRAGDLEHAWATTSPIAPDVEEVEG